MSGFFDGQDISPNAIEQALAARRARGLALIDLTSSNPTRHGFIFPKDILLEESRSYLEARRYEPDAKGLLAARQAVSQYYSRRRPALALTPEDVILTAGSSESYSLLFSLLCEPGDNLLAPDVTYPLFELLAAHHRIGLKLYRLVENRGWEIDQDSILHSIDSRTRGILLVSPHNPTGMVIRTPLAALAAQGLPVICDEVFSEFYYDAPVPPFGALHPELPVFHLNGISKMFALPDLKLGWIAMNEAAGARFTHRLELLNDVFLGASSLIQHLLPAVFKRGGEFVRSMREAVNGRLNQAIKQLESSPVFMPLRPQGGYALFVRLRRNLDEERLVLSLIEKGALAHPGYFYGCQDGAHLMISCLLQEDELRKGLGILMSGCSSIET